jgi:tetratricopeptide (TPR) repeat protein
MMTDYKKWDNFDDQDSEDEEEAAAKEVLELAQQRSNADQFFGRAESERKKAKKSELYQQAIDLYKRILSKKPKDQSLLLACNMNIAAALVKCGRFDDAIHHCTLALSLDSANQKALHFRGFAHSNLGHKKDALRDLQAALALTSDKADAEDIQELITGLEYIGIPNALPTADSQVGEEKAKEMFKGGIAAYRAGRVDDAIKLWATLVANAECDEKLRGLVHGNLAMAYQKKRDLDKAAEHLKQASSCAASCGQLTRVGSVESQLAALLVQAGKMEEALPCYARAIKALRKERAAAGEEGPTCTTDTTGNASALAVLYRYMHRTLYCCTHTLSTGAYTAHYAAVLTRYLQVHAMHRTLYCCTHTLSTGLWGASDSKWRRHSGGNLAQGRMTQAGGCLM